MRIHQLSVFVDDQDKAELFYADVLGFAKKHDVPLGTDRWLTMVSPDAPDGPEVLLEPARHPVVQAYKTGLAADGIPAVSFAVDDLHAEFDRLSELGVQFTQEPLEMGPAITAILDDTCGNLIQLVQHK